MDESQAAALGDAEAGEHAGEDGLDEQAMRVRAGHGDVDGASGGVRAGASGSAHQRVVRRAARRAGDAHRLAVDFAQRLDLRHEVGIGQHAATAAAGEFGGAEVWGHVGQTISGNMPINSSSVGIGRVPASTSSMI